MQRLALRWKTRRVQIGFVPTMGCLHAGHLSLVREARRRVAARGKVVVSIYVNPTQFAPNEDFSKYPRTFAADRKLCRDAGVDVIFTPSDREMYLPNHSTFVVEERLARGLEAATRPTHFRGVTTIVAKLFHCVLPDVAVFGAKDFQQAAIIQRMVRDLNFPLQIAVAPTWREADGLALSSRNRYLSPAQRTKATLLALAIAQARKLVALKLWPAARLKQKLAREIAREPAARLDYLEFFDPDTLEKVSPVKPGAQMALAVFFGKTRLIDNGRL